MSLPKVPNPAQVVLELPPGYEGSGDPRPRREYAVSTNLSSSCYTGVRGHGATAPRTT